MAELRRNPTGVIFQNQNITEILGFGMSVWKEAPGAAEGLRSTSTVNSFTATWDAITDAATYNFRFRVKDSGAWTTRTGLASATRTEGSLTAVTTYEWQVQGVNSSNSAGDWSTSAEVTTDELAIPTVTAGSITRTSTAIALTAVTAATEYDIRYRERSTSAWTTLTDVGRTETISGLDTNTMYEVQGRAVQNAHNGPWSTSTNFTTNNLSVPGTSITGTGLTTITVTVGTVSGANAYDMRFRRTGTQTWTTRTNITSPVTETGLVVNTEYEAQGRAKDGDGNVSQWSNSDTASTSGLARMAAPRRTSRTGTSIAVSWTKVSQQTTTNLRSRTGTGAWATLSNLSGTTRNLTGLTQGAAYEIQVQANGPGNTSSDWSPSLNDGTVPAAVRINADTTWNWAWSWISAATVTVVGGTSGTGGPRKPSEDFDPLTGIANPIGIWSDGTTMWVINQQASDNILAYNLSTKARDSAKDFTTLNAAGNNVPNGLWSDGTTMWVGDTGDDKIYAYNLSTKARDSAKDFNTIKAAGNTSPVGLWSDGTTMWIADTDDTVYAYVLSTKARDSAKDFTGPNVSGTPRGMWSDGTTIWIGNRGTSTVENNKLFAYNLSTKARDSAKDFTTLSAAGNRDGAGIWSDGTTMWVSDSTDDKIYAYHPFGLGGTTSFGTNDADGGATETVNLTGQSTSDSYVINIGDAGSGSPAGAAGYVIITPSG